MEDPRSWRARRPTAWLFAALTTVVAAAAPPTASARRGAPPPRPLTFELRSLDGSANNRAHPTWGAAGTPYARLAPANYADGAGAMVSGANPRYTSNRTFNSLGVDVFSERNVSQLVWTWGQFMDHTFGLAQSGSEDASIPFSSTDPLERFRNDLGQIPIARDAVAPGTGTGPSNPRQQVNTVSSYIDGWSVYGGTPQRLDWLREGPDDGNLADSGPHLLLSDGYLPRATARGNPGAAPTMVIDGQLIGHPQDATVAGDVRANENASLTALHTLFAREHNRIVDALPASLRAELRFQIARRVVGAEQQYITYREFLPAVGARLRPYRGYRRRVNASLLDEFATVAYRAHSMINGESHITVPASQYTPPQLSALQAMGVEVNPVAGSSPPQLALNVSLNVAFFNPDLLSALGLGTELAGLAREPGYNNDEQIDDALRSILFKFPGPTVSDPSACFEDPTTPGCFQGVVDLGAIDVQRGRDNGMPTYNQLRQAVGLAPKRSFTAITGEATDSFGSDPQINPADPIDDPHSLDFTSLRDFYGNPIAAEDASSRVVFDTRRSTLAARLRAIYGSVDNVDAFAGLVSEAHLPGTEFGQLQLALWRKQFEALRDGDRFFYLNDPVLEKIRRRYGISFRHTLSQLIALDAGVPADSLPANAFFAPLPPRPSAVTSPPHRPAPALPGGGASPIGPGASGPAAPGKGASGGGGGAGGGSGTGAGGGPGAGSGSGSGSGSGGGSGTGPPRHHGPPGHSGGHGPGRGRR